MATIKITNAQIKALSDEAASAGDDMQHATCLVALEGPIDSFEERFGGGGLDLSRSQREQLEEMTQDEARSICAQAIADAKAME